MTNIKVDHRFCPLKEFISGVQLLNACHGWWCGEDPHKMTDYHIDNMTTNKGTGGSLYPHWGTKQNTLQIGGNN